MLRKILGGGIVFALLFSDIYANFRHLGIFLSKKSPRRNISVTTFDLTPFYLIDENFRKIHILKLKKKYLTAIKKIDTLIDKKKSGIPSENLQFLKATLLIENGKLKKGIKLLKGIKNLKFLDDHINYLIAKTYLKMKDFKNAKKFFSKLSENHFGFVESRFFLSENFIKEKKPEIAISILNELLLKNLTVSQKEELFLKLAEAYILMGEYLRAREICLYLYMNGKRKIKKRAIKCMENSGFPLNKVERLLSIIVNARHKELRRLYIHANKEKKKFLKIDRGIFDFIVGEYQRRIKENLQSAIKFYEKALEFAQNQELRRKILFNTAIALRKFELENSAIELYWKLLNEYPFHPENPKHILSLLQLLMRAGEFKAGEELYNNSIREYPMIKKEGLFILAIYDFYNKRFEECEKKIEKLTELNKNSGKILSERLLYWKARTAQELKKDEEAFEGFFSLIKKSPLSYYGLFSLKWFREKFIPDFYPVKNNSISCNFSKFHEWRDISENVIFFLKMGFFKTAFSILEWRFKEAKISEEEKVIFACLSHRLNRGGDFRTISASGNITSNLSIESRIFFPTPYIREVEKVSNETGVPSEFIYSVMMFESNFREKAYSEKGAVGLMQILPSTARYVAKKYLNNNSFKIKNFYKPELNIRISAYYISELLKLFKENFLLALIGYSGGPYYVQKRLLGKKATESDIFLEVFPSKSIKKYIKRIVSAYGKYSFLYNKENPYTEMPLYIF